MRCGFLGAMPRPDSSTALADLGEVTAEYRQRWEHALRTAREMKKLHGSEYDPTMGQDLGIDSGTPFGVMCALGRSEGPGRPTFHVPGRRETQAEFMQHRSEGFIIREPDASLPSPFGRVVGVVQTFVWPLVRPHSCQAFMRYKAGLSPAQHVDAREGVRKWRKRAVVGLLTVVLGSLATVLFTRWFGG